MGADHFTVSSAARAPVRKSTVMIIVAVMISLRVIELLLSIGSKQGIPQPVRHWRGFNLKTK
jgi:hypothetical protein